MASTTAAGSAYATHGEPMIPFYIFYSMFGFQRTGDSIWAMADQLGPRLPDRRHRRPHDADRRGPAARRRPLAAARGDQPGGRALRPGVRLRDRHIVQDGLRRMYGRPTSTRTARTSSTTSPSTTSRSCSPSRARRPRRRGLLKGIYHLADAPDGDGDGARGSSCSPPVSASRGSSEAQQMLAEEWGVRRRRLVGDLVERARPRRRRGRAVEPPPPRRGARGRRTSPTSSADADGPVVAVSDYMRAVPGQIAQLGARRLPRRSAPTASASPTPGRPPAASSSRRRVDRGAALAGAGRARRGQARGGRRRRSTSTGSTTRPRSAASSRRAATPDVEPGASVRCIDRWSSERASSAARVRLASARRL